MSELVLARRKWVPGRGVVPSTLRNLGIEFRTVAGEDFWKANAHLLEDLHAEFVDEARRVLRRLHPDAGGDAREFDRFMQAVQKTRVAFARHRVGLAPRISMAVAAIPTSARVRDTAKAFRVLGLLREGRSGGYIRRQLGCSDKFVRKVRAVCGSDLQCGCGRASGHIGPCAFNVPRGPNHNAWFRGRPLSLEHRQTLSRVLTGRAKSEITRRRMARASAQRTRNNGRYAPEMRAAA